MLNRARLFATMLLFASACDAADPAMSPPDSMLAEVDAGDGSGGSPAAPDAGSTGTGGAGGGGSTGGAAVATGGTGGGVVGTGGTASSPGTGGATTKPDAGTGGAPDTRPAPTAYPSCPTALSGESASRCGYLDARSQWVWTYKDGQKCGTCTAPGGKQRVGCLYSVPAQPAYGHEAYTMLCVQLCGECR
jgi:hypothetical protein